MPQPQKFHRLPNPFKNESPLQVLINEGDISVSPACHEKENAHLHYACAFLDTRFEFDSGKKNDLRALVCS